MSFVPAENFSTRSKPLYDAETQRIDVIMYKITEGTHADGLIRAVKRGIPVRLDHRARALSQQGERLARLPDRSPLHGRRADSPSRARGLHPSEEHAALQPGDDRLTDRRTGRRNRTSPSPNTTTSRPSRGSSPGSATTSRANGATPPATSRPRRSFRCRLTRRSTSRRRMGRRTSQRRR